MNQTFKTRALREPLFVPNKFVFSFITEFDAFLYNNPDVRNKIGVARYKSRNRRNDITIDYDNGDITYGDDHADFNETDFSSLFALIIYFKNLMSIEDSSLYEILNYSSHSTSEKDYIEGQWVQLIGNDNISHASLIYTFLNNDSIPKNIAVPLIKDLGFETSVIEDKNLSEPDFISKYDGNLYLPIVITDNNISAISKFLTLLNFDAIKSDLSTPNGIRYFCMLDDKSFITLACYYIILKNKYSEDYNAFLNLRNFKELFNLYIKSENIYIEQLYYPSLKFLYFLSTVDVNKYIIFDRIFTIVHYDVNYEHSSEMIDLINIFATVFPKIVEVYKHYCSRNGVTPKVEIIAVGDSQNHVDYREEFLNSFHESNRDPNTEFNLGLSSLDGEGVYNLYNVLINGYIDASQTTLEQFCYALTGKMRPEKIEQVEWKGSIDEFALFVNALFARMSGNKPQALLSTIFTGTDCDFNRDKITSRCCRVDSKKHTMFVNRIKKALKSE